MCQEINNASESRVEMIVFWTAKFKNNFILILLRNVKKGVIKILLLISSSFINFSDFEFSINGHIKIKKYGKKYFCFISLHVQYMC